MLTYTTDILAAAKRAVDEHPDDIAHAVACAEAKIRHLPEFQEMVNKFITASIRELVYRFRSARNDDLKTNGVAPREVARPKVTGGSQDVLDAYKSLSVDYYGYFIGGRTLGSIMGEELEDIAARERMTGDGYHFRARLATMLREVVPLGKTVRQAVSAKKLAAIFEAAEKRSRSA